MTIIIPILKSPLFFIRLIIKLSFLLPLAMASVTYAGDQIYATNGCQMYGGHKTVEGTTTPVAFRYIDNSLLIFRQFDRRASEIIMCPINLNTDTGQTAANIDYVRVYGGPALKAKVCFHNRYGSDVCGAQRSTDPYTRSVFPNAQVLHLYPPASVSSNSSAYISITADFTTGAPLNQIHEYTVRFD